MTQQFSPHMLILLWPRTSYKPPCMKYKTGSKNGAWKLMRLNPHTSPLLSRKLHVRHSKQHVPPAKRWSKIPGKTPGPSTNLAKAYNLQKEAPRPTITQALLDHWTTFTTVSKNILLYKVTLKPIWTYRIQLWGTASNSNIDILERFQSKVLRIITNEPRYVPNAMLRRDLQDLSVKQDLMNHSITYRQLLINHPNQLATTLYLKPTYNRRLKSRHPADLQTRYKT